MSFSAKNIQHNEQPITYDEALARIAKLASTTIASRDKGTRVSANALLEGHALINADRESVTLLEAVGRKSFRTLCAPHSTPRIDTSAMDGFAVNARTAAKASANSPVRLRIIDSIVAGDDESRIAMHCDSAGSDDVCVEIMTGACFPERKLPHLDSVVKIEDVILQEDCSKDGSSTSRYIELSKPVKAFQHRRPAGSDFTKGDVIVEHGTVFEPKHIAALASLGYTRLEVLAHSYEAARPVPTESGLPLRIGVLSTGSEVVEQLDKKTNIHRQDLDSRQSIPDSNGPYLVSSLKTAFPFIAVDYLGVVRDDEDELTIRLGEAIFEDCFDVIITSGGVSKGRHDLVRYVLETRLKGRVIFHGVKIRPGAPVLLTSFDHPSGAQSKAGRRQTAVFGAPGNPLATAVALRFFVMPYIIRSNLVSAQQAVGRNAEATVSAMKNEDEDASTKLQPLHRKPRDTTVFRLVRRQVGAESHVQFVEDQASYKLRGLLEADCWAIAPAGVSEIVCGDQLAVSPL